MAGEKRKPELPMSAEEFGRQYKAAVGRGRKRMETELSAERAHYDRRKHRIVVELNNGCTFIFPPDKAQGLRGAAPEDLARVEVLPTGAALRWPSLDADFTIAGLLAGIFGTKAWMSELGRRGGSVTSETKAAAARENGATGGRPRKRRAG